MKDYGIDNQANKVIDKILNERRAAQAISDKNTPKVAPQVKAERRRVARALGESTKSPLALDLIRQYGRVPDSVLKEMANRKMRWGL